MVKQADMMAGGKVGWLTLVQRFQKPLATSRNVAAWRCVCVCGNQVERIGSNLAKGKGDHCGCKRRYKIVKAKKAKVPKHLAWAFPYAKQHEYRVYSQMVQRCHLETAPNYIWYGAKGVQVCDRWRYGEDGMTGFECFLTDMGKRPDGLTLDRINPFQDYTPENCRWTTWAEQGVNRRSHWEAA